MINAIHECLLPLLSARIILFIIIIMIVTIIIEKAIMTMITIVIGKG